MSEINILDHLTIDQIAAGEVVERPASVVKELVENAIDANASAITVEIKDGGITLIRVTDNGQGIEKSQIKKAFLRHATSKIKDATDLQTCLSLGFRGEALASIAAVSMIECISKTTQDLTGVRYQLNGGTENSLEEVGAPSGTTFLVRNLFYNTPARKKFLKAPQTEAGYVTDIMEHVALSKPEISFSYIVNGNQKFHTSGNGNLKDVVYKIYGKDVIHDLIEVNEETSIFQLRGFIGKPSLTRANRNFETFFVNQRYIKSQLLSKALEEGYKSYLMLHKFPFSVLHLQIDTEKVDVNVHPTKLEVRFSEQATVYQNLYDVIIASLKEKELIPTVQIEPEKEVAPEVKKAGSVPEPFEMNRQLEVVMEKESVYGELEEIPKQQPLMQENMQKSILSKILGGSFGTEVPKNEKNISNIIKQKEHIIVEKAEQLGLFSEKLLSEDAKEAHNVLGQLFDTYWLVSFSDKLFIVDQHAAHEKVKYEALMEQYRKNEMTSQNINPPIIISMTGLEEELFCNHQDAFKILGFEVESFGGSEYAIRAIPSELYGADAKELFLVTLDELSEYGNKATSPSVVIEKIASMSCKAAVKGNHSMNQVEFASLFEQLLTLENPYNCPHGRPTIISMSKYEIEKKFKRIL